ncbi:Hypothetical_protein [Hexamita inflata]|uniref:Hypothetical_protein n=1 Tax=Hexamita inflata TaxID=28002 RepID=A0AA86QDH6_9EUKA|nr:Hypothetical protein HINF_LOCUS40508 [Hexamita inflata]
MQNDEQLYEVLINNDTLISLCIDQMELREKQKAEYVKSKMRTHMDKGRAQTFLNDNLIDNPAPGAYQLPQIQKSYTNTIFASRLDPQFYDVRTKLKIKDNCPSPQKYNPQQKSKQVPQKIRGIDRFNEDKPHEITKQLTYKSKDPLETSPSRTMNKSSRFKSKDDVTIKKYVKFSKNGMF